MSNRHPVDQLAEVRAQIRALQEKEAELRALVLDGCCDLAGDDYVAIVKTRPQVRLDLVALRKHFPPGQLKRPCAAKRMIVDGRMPTPEEAWRQREERKTVCRRNAGTMPAA